MKKIINLFILLILLVSCLSGCKSNEKQIIDKIGVEDIKEALIKVGYSDANFSPLETSFEKWGAVYLDNTKTNYISQNNLYGDYLPAFFFEEDRNDIPKILDAVMPLYDKDYKQGDGEKIVKSLKSDRFFSDDYTCGGSINFKDYEYREFLDETNSYTDCIMVEYKYK